MSEQMPHHGICISGKLACQSLSNINLTLTGHNAVGDSEQQTFITFGM